MNVNVVASISAPNFYLTYAQTALLLADAAKRGFIPGGDTEAKQYYEAGIIADMDKYSLYLKRNKFNFSNCFRVRAKCISCTRWCCI